MAETITINVPHKHTRLEAKSRIEGGFEKAQQQVAGKGVRVEQAWNGDRMDFSAGVMGQKVTGNLVVTDEHVVIEVDLPWMLRALSGKVQEQLRSGTQMLLEKK